MRSLLILISDTEEDLERQHAHYLEAGEDPDSLSIFVRDRFLEEAPL